MYIKYLESSIFGGAKNKALHDRSQKEAARDRLKANAAWKKANKKKG